MLTLAMRRINIITIILIVIQGISMVECGRAVQDESNSGTYDLNANYTMNLPELTFTRLIVMPRSWDTLFLNLTVQNYGEAIESILISSKINDILTEDTFSSNERVGLKNCLVYQFDQPQTIIIPLNFFYQEILSVSISIHLDSLVSWREVEYNFEILSAFLHGVNLAYPLNDQPLMILSREFHFTLQSSQISYFGKRLLLRSYFPVGIPDNMFLSIVLEVSIFGAQFDYVTLGSDNNHVIDRNFVRINATINKDDLKDQIWQSTLYIIPYIESQDDYSMITLSLRAHGVLKAINFSNKDLDLTKHPIPGFIMTPVLIFLLFGIPYYYVYQEELTEKDDRIIDSELGKM